MHHVAIPQLNGSPIIQKQSQQYDKYYLEIVLKILRMLILFMEMSGESRPNISCYSINK